MFLFLSYLRPPPYARDALTIRGMCGDLEKSYFRLTSAPDPATVRPQPVLQRALRRLMTLEVKVVQVDNNGLTPRCFQQSACVSTR